MEKIGHLISFYDIMPQCNVNSLSVISSFEYSRVEPSGEVRRDGKRRLRTKEAGGREGGDH